MASLSTPDLCVIGAGASGLAVAAAARRLGASVTLVERGPTGGASLRSGALALQALAASARVASLAGRSAQFGVAAEPPKVSFRKVHDSIAEIVAGAASQSGAARLAALGIELVRGTGAFADPRTLRAGDSEIKARRFVLATGSRPILPDIPGLFSVPYFTTDTIFDNTRKLTHLVLIGAGPMGLELALSHRRLGCEVTVVEPGRVLPQSDPELVEIALRRLREEGVVIHEESAIVAVQARSQGIGVVVRARDEPLTLDASHILVAAGRVANLEDLNLEAGRIRRSKSDPGALSLNASLRTTNPRVFAVGEAAGHAPAAHLAALEADLVVRAALLGQPARYEPAALPRLTLTDPEIAEIGLTEPMARGRFKSGFSVLRASYAENDRARAARAGTGLAKLIVARTGRILGAGVVGEGAAELAALFALAIEQGIEVRRLAELAALFALAIEQGIEVRRLAELAAPHPSHADLARLLGEQAASAASRTPWTARRLALNRLLP